MSNEKELFQRRYEREKFARLEAEKLLEIKSLELYRSNNELIRLNENQEIIIKERTAELQASETNYQSLVESISDLICKTDLDGTIKFVNKITSQTLGYAVESIIGKNIFDFIAPSHRKKAFNYVARQFKNQVCISYLEFPLLTKDGKEKWLGNNIQFIDKQCLSCERKYKHLAGFKKNMNSKNCTFTEIVIVARDISIQREAEQITQAQSKQLEKLFNQQVIISETALELNALENFDTKINNAIAQIGHHIDISRVYIFENSQRNRKTSLAYEWCNTGIKSQKNQLQNISLERIKSWKDIIAKEKMLFAQNIHDLPKDIVAILEPQEVKSILVLPLTVNNLPFGIIAFEECTPDRVWDKSEIELLKTVSNVISNAFERKRIETDLKLSEKENRIIIEAIPDLIFIHDKNNKIKAHKKGKENKFIVGFEELGNRAVEDIFPQQYSAEIAIALHESRTNGSFQFDFQYEINQNIRNLEVRMFKLNEDDVISIVRDVTETKENEKQLKIAKEKAENASRSKSEFLANVSHEIRTPMNAILGFSEILLDKITEPQYQDHLRTILSSGRTLLSLINDILDLSKIEAGKLEVEYEPVQYSSVLREIEQVFSPKIQKKQLSFEIITNAAVPDFIYMDEVRFHQILFNLVGNAIKFTSKGFVRLETFVEYTSDENKVNLIIEIEDTGIGIPNDQLETIFEAFTQQSGQSNRKYEGTGLGLAITKRLIEKMNGTIKVNSQVGKGSTFIIVFSNVQLAELRSPVDVQKNNENAELIFDKATIMIVDDIDFNIKVLKTMLDYKQFSFIEATSGEAALELLEFEKPDIIFMDIRMHGMSGISATEIIKEKMMIKAPVIAFTASAMHSQIDRIKVLFDGYLRKPVSKKVLLQTLKEHLNYSYGKSNSFEINPLGNIEQDELCIEHAPELVEAIQQDLYAEWKNISDSLVIFEIEEFCEKLSKLSNEHRCNPMIQYSKRLMESLQTFDVELIEVHIKEFGVLFEQLKSKSNK